MRRLVKPSASNKDALAIFEAERFIQRVEILGRLPSSRSASELLAHLARVVAIAKRLTHESQPVRLVEGE